MDRAPLLSEGSISASMTRAESATAQSAVTEQLAHLSTAPKPTSPQLRSPLQGPSCASPPTARGLEAATAVPMDSTGGGKAARKQQQSGQPVPDAAWGGDDAVPNDKRLYTVRTVAHGIVAVVQTGCR